MLLYIMKGKCVDIMKKNLLLYLLSFMTTMVFVTISSYLAIAELSDFKNAKDTLTIFISIIGLFATFGGAYLGAKISGDNARENMLEQLKLSREIDLEKFEIEYKIKLLKDLYDEVNILYYKADQVAMFTNDFFDNILNKTISLEENNKNYLINSIEKINIKFDSINEEASFLELDNKIFRQGEKYDDFVRDLRNNTKIDFTYIKSTFCNNIPQIYNGKFNMANMYSTTCKSLLFLLDELKEKRKEYLKKLNS